MKARHLPGLVVLLAMTVMMPVSQGVESPLPQETPPARPTALVEHLPAEKRLAAVDEVEAPPIYVLPAEPVEETPRVEDSYFDNAVFLGDSRTDGLRLYGRLGRGRYYYSTGATVESVFTKAVETPAGEMPLLDALREIDPKPDRIFVMLGVNELGWPEKEKFETYYVQLIERLRMDHPDSDILVQTILPVTKAQDAKKTYVCNSRIAYYNEMLRKACGVTNCTMLDVGAGLTDEEGFLPAAWSYDGVHLNRKGCEVWLDYLRTHAVNYDVFAEESEA